MSNAVFKYNDGGRSEAGYKGATGDCGTRALAIATHLSYKEVYELVKVYATRERITKRKNKRSHPRTGIHTRTFKKIMEDLGWKWVPTMHIGSGCKVHVNSDELPNGCLILNLSRHFSVMIDGILHDTYDCSRDGTRCVYGYWTK